MEIVAYEYFVRHQDKVAPLCFKISAHDEGQTVRFCLKAVRNFVQ